MADAFTPQYHISAAERAGTGFATFADSVPQRVSAVFPPVPPISYFRVEPLGTASLRGAPVGVLRIDYLTLWNRDDGFRLGGICATAVTLVESLIGDLVIGGHNLDNERSAALVAAPLVNGSYDPDPAHYAAYSYFTAAHEGDAVGDNSAYDDPDPPAPAGTHLALSQSRGKHSTYPFNPQGHQVIRPQVQALTFSIIDGLHAAGTISDGTYQTFLFLADQAFHVCVVEAFTEQGGSPAGTRIDVGEPSHPLGGSGFIDDPDAAQLLRERLSRFAVTISGGVAGRTRAAPRGWSYWTSSRNRRAAPGARPPHHYRSGFAALADQGIGPFAYGAFVDQMAAGPP